VDGLAARFKSHELLRVDTVEVNPNERAVDGFEVEQHLEKIRGMRKKPAVVYALEVAWP